MEKLTVLNAVKIVLKDALSLIGVSAPEKCNKLYLNVIVNPKQANL